MNKIINKHPLIFVITIVCVMITIVYYPYIRNGCGYFCSTDTVFESWPYIKYLSDSLNNGNIPMWTFSIGLGGRFYLGYVGEFAKFLTALLGMLLGTEYIPQIILLIHCAKIIVCCIFFCKYLNKLKFGNISCICGSILYGFCGIMVFGGMRMHYATEMVILSMMLYSLELYFKDNKRIPLVICIVLVFIYNGIYYVYLYSLELFFYALIRYFIAEDFKWRHFFSYIVNCLFIYLISLLISSIIVIPSIFAALDSSRGTHLVESIDIFQKFFKFASKDRIVAIFNSLLSPGITGVFNGSRYLPSAGLDGPALYCGIISVLAIPQSFKFMSRKMRYAVFTVIALICAYLFFPGITNIINLGINPNYFKLASLWISVVLIVLSSYSIDNMIKSKYINIKLICYTFLILIMIFLYVNFLNSYYSEFVNKKVAYKTIAILLVWTMYFIILHKYNKKHVYLNYLFILFIMTDVVLMDSYPIWGTYNFSKSVLVYGDKSSDGYYGDLYDSINSIKENDSSFYRISKDFYTSEYIFGCKYQTESLFYGYNGLEFRDSYISSSNAAFYKACDIEFNSHICYFPKGRQGLESFLGVKYYISNKNTLPEIYTLKGKIGTMVIGENPYALPIAFTYDKTIQSDDFENLSIKEKDVALFNSFIPDDRFYNIFEDYDNVFKDTNTYTKQKLELSSYQLCENFIEKNENSFSFTAVDDGAKAVFNVNGGLGNYTISFDVLGEEHGIGRFLWYDGTNWNAKQFKISNKKSNVQITLSNTSVNFISFEPTDKTGEIANEAYVFENININKIDDSTMISYIADGYKDRTKDKFEISNFSQNSFSGNITINDEKMLFFSVPYDRGWTIKANGEKLEKYCINYGFIGVPLSKGSYYIELNYVTPGLKIGAFLCIVGIALILLLEINAKKLITSSDL